ncbi:MAG: hypothetical protein ABWZ25_08480 [Chitinophagaceae bacterium]
MKQFRFFATVLVATGMLYISSCNSAEEKKVETTDSDTTAVPSEAPAVTTPAPSGPKMVMTIRHKIANYNKWLPFYEDHDSMRLAYGLHNYVIARGVDDSNLVMVALIMDDVNKAKELTATSGMKNQMKKAGVTGPTSIDYLESVMNDTAAIQQTVRLMVKHKVKDWDSWKKSFDSNHQARVEAGLTDRVISHTIGDDHEVTLVFAVADLEKARNFAKSKELKAKMAEAGVEGVPDFYYYTIAKRY